MKLSTSLVAVKKISSNISRSNFNEDDLNRAAELILQTEGIINPLIVRRTSLDSYEVVDGDFEYYVATRAREIDPRKGEMIGAFIIEPENEEALTEQVKVLRKNKSPSLGNEVQLSNVSDSRITNIESRQANLELRTETKFAEQAQKLQTLAAEIKAEIKELKTQQKQKITPLEAFNSLNLTELAFRLKDAGFNSQKASDIAKSIENQRKKGKFESLKDVIAQVKIKSGKKQITAISSNKMIDIIDSWSRLY